MEVIQQHPLLDQDCHHYLEAMLKMYDLIVNTAPHHLKFLQYWFKCIEPKSKELDEQTILSIAFAYFFKELGNTTINEAIENNAKNYLDELQFYYNDLGNEGHKISEFIKSYRLKKHQRTIYTFDIKWFPWYPQKNNKDYLRNKKFIWIALELQFVWSVARLWQLFRHRDEDDIFQNYLVNLRNFLGLNNNLNLNNSTHIPDDLIKALQNSNTETKDFFEKYIYYFNPIHLTTDQMCCFFKKACKSSISDKTKTTALKNFLRKIWLLGKFYLIHFYPLNFIKNDRGLPDRVIKQFDAIDNLKFIKNFKIKDLEKLIKNGRKKWNSKQIQNEEIWVSIASNKDDLSLQKKEQHIIKGLENNPYEDQLKNIREKRTKESLLNEIDLLIRKEDSEKTKNCKQKILESVQTDPKSYIRMMIIFSIFDLTIYKQMDNISISEDNSSNDEFYEAIADCAVSTNDDTYTAESPTKEICPQGCAMIFLFNLVLSKFMIHEKNLTLVTIDYFDKDFINNMMSVLSFSCVAAYIGKILETWKQPSKT